MESFLEALMDINRGKIAQWCCSTIMVFGGVVPYLPQYQDIYLKQDAEGFSMYVCLALLVANTLRILFWFGKRYELPLLFQSIVMNIMMLLMIHLCVNVRNETHLIIGPDRYFTDFDWHYFWQWTDFQSYIDCLIVISICLSVITFIFIHNVIFVEIIGFLALLTEAMLGVPQLVTNLRNRSTEGMSVLMVLLWIIGDTLKTCYFVIGRAPLQFWMCGILQIMIDLTIFGQAIWYHNEPHNKNPRIN